MGRALTLVIVQYVIAIFFDETFELDQCQHPVFIAFVLMHNTVEVFVESPTIVLAYACRDGRWEVFDVFGFVVDTRE